MNLSSSAFNHNQSIPKKYTCDGENINPPFSISDVPENAKMLAFIMDDPDAPRGTWIHWTIWNIPVDTADIPEGSRPKGIEGMTSFGKPGYGGPCPPIGTHRYFFKLFALDRIADIPQGTEPEKIEGMLEKYALSKAELIGLYNRSAE